MKSKTVPIKLNVFTSISTVRCAYVSYHHLILKQQEQDTLIMALWIFLSTVRYKRKYHIFTELVVALINNVQRKITLIRSTSSVIRVLSAHLKLCCFIKAWFYVEYVSVQYS